MKPLLTLGCCLIAALAAAADDGTVPTSCSSSRTTMRGPITGFWAIRTLKHRTSTRWPDAAPYSPAATCPRRCAARRWRPLPLACTRISTGSAATIRPYCLPWPARAQEAKRRPGRIRRAFARRLISHLDQHPTMAGLLGQQGYLSHQSGKWWEGNYRRGGFTHGMTRGFPQSRRAARRRRSEDRPRRDAAGVRVHRSAPPRRAEAVLPLVRALPAAHTAQSAGPPLPEIQSQGHRVRLRCAVLRHGASGSTRRAANCSTISTAKGSAENTLVVYLADNGWIQQPDGAGFAPRSKQSANEGGVRQPIMFCWPGVIQAGDRGEQLCSSVDIVPTAARGRGCGDPREPARLQPAADPEIRRAHAATRSSSARPSPTTSRTSTTRRRASCTAG